MSGLRQVKSNHWEYDVRQGRRTTTFDLKFIDGPVPLWWVTRSDRTGGAIPCQTMDEAIEEAHKMAESGYS